MISLGEKEYQFACIIWEHQPLASSDLVELAKQQMGWKKSTTYTVLKKLIQKGIANNENAIVTMLITKDQIDHFETNRLISRVFQGSLPKFITAFYQDKKITRAEIDQLEQIIRSYKEEQNQ